ncbi:MAG TPA: M56 family metallopeptidase [Steroidobacteraceae bacterium]|nr:M56 family metallopeptidase [Steroidobacteraceae bacterium]
MSAIADHLWQSSWFALVAWLLAMVVRHDSAKLRGWIWLAASAKFLFPFALFSWIGSQFVFQASDPSAVLPLVQHVASPLSSASVATRYLESNAQWLLLVIWAPISAMYMQRVLLGWIDSRSLLRGSWSCDVLATIPVRASHAISNPCVIGVVDPVLVLPARFESTFSPAQLRAVIAHELEHVRRHDNLVAYIHSFVQALFWFHPLVWLIGSRIVREREQACDEAAIESGLERRDYAATLLRICQHSIGPQKRCVAYAASADLPLRIAAIMSQCRISSLRRCMLVCAAFLCIAVPFASGMNVVVTSLLHIDAGARSIHVSGANGPSVLVMGQNYVYGRNVSLRELIGRTWSVGMTEVHGELRELDHPRYDIQIRAVSGSVADSKDLVSDLLRKRFNVQLVRRVSRVHSDADALMGRM